MKSITALIFTCLSLNLSAQIHLNNDEFSDAATLVNWQNINQTEGWNITQLENYNIGDTVTGSLFMMPLSASWFGEYRGALLYKEIAGDFVVTTSVSVSARDNISLPATDFSLAGIMIRNRMDYPNNNASIDWAPLEQNYIFMSIGRANQDNRYSFEIKNTCDSRSCLNIVDADSTSALIRMIRRDSQIVVMSKFGSDSWTIQNRYNRGGPMNGSIGNCGGICGSLFSDTVQIGFVTYTDWPKVSSLDPSFHNSHTIHPDSLGMDDPTPGTAFNPDLKGSFDFIRFDSLDLPEEWLTLDLSDSTQVSDLDFISQYGYDSQVNCPDSVTVSQYPILDQRVQVVSDSLIVSMASIDSTKEVLFNSLNQILLQNGFEVEAGAIFSATLEGCSEEP